LLKLSLVAKKAGTELGSWVVTREAGAGGKGKEGDRDRIRARDRDRGRDRIRDRKTFALTCRIWS